MRTDVNTRPVGFDNKVNCWLATRTDLQQCCKEYICYNYWYCYCNNFHCWSGALEVQTHYSYCLQGLDSITGNEMGAGGRMGLICLLARSLTVTV